MQERLFDDDAFESAIAAATARVAIISQGKNLVRASSDGSGHFEAVFLSAAEADALVDDPGSVSVSLGSYGGADYFACDISHLADFEPPSGTAFEQLRSVGGALGRDEDAGLLAVARGMAVWHRSVRCCQSCGSKDMAPAKAGSMRRCGACGAGAYPRIDPSVIVLVTACDGELALLGRKANWPEGRYSTLAGFCEVGESLEETVVREVCSTLAESVPLPPAAVPECVLM
jgi:NAD+ diphosphatase